MKKTRRYYLLLPVFLFDLDEGIARIYRNYSEDTIELLTSWRLSTDIGPSSIGLGLVCEWHQGRGILFSGGMSKNIKFWDAEEEACVQVF